MTDSRRLRESLRLMDEQIVRLLALADEHREYLIGAILSEAHAHVMTRYIEATSP